MRRVFATDFGVWPILQDLGRLSDAMLHSKTHWARLANYLLLYDQVVIPTGNLQVLPVLRLILGEDAFDYLIRTKGIVLARFDQWFGYAGNGAGLVFFTVHENPDLPTRGPNLGMAYFRPIDEAIDIALTTTNPQSNADRRSHLKSLLLDNIVLLPTEQIADNLKDEAYQDILNSPYLRDFLSLRNAGRTLNNLIGLGPNKITVFNPHFPPQPGDIPEIRSVLRVAFENFVLRIGGYSEATEITGDDITLNILRAKGQRMGFSIEGERVFTQIQKVSGIPDIGVAFANKQLSSTQLLELRDSKHCQSLRDWFAKGSPADSAEDTVCKYVDSLGKPNWLSSLPVKLLRFVITMGIGAIEPISGVAASFVDSLLLSKWFPGRSPRLFLEQAKIMLENSSPISKPVMRGRDRNKPCPCGSGKKYKMLRSLIVELL